MDSNTGNAEQSKFVHAFAIKRACFTRDGHERKHKTTRPTILLISYNKSMEFNITTQDGYARRGQLSLSHGVIETPVFMPVGTYGAVKSLTPDDLNDLGAQIILGNTFHLMLRPGTGKSSRHIKDLHGFMNWQKTHPYRFRRLPSVQPGRFKENHGSGRDLQVTYRRQQDFYGAGGIHAGAARFGFRYCHDFR